MPTNSNPNEPHANPTLFCPHCGKAIPATERIFMHPISNKRIYMRLISSGETRFVVLCSRACLLALEKEYKHNLTVDEEAKIIERTKRPL